MSAILNENGLNLIKPHPYKQIARRLFPMLALLNLCFWSLVAACNFLFNLSFFDIAYDAYLFAIFSLAHILFFRVIIGKLYCLSYKSFRLVPKDKASFSYIFYLKLLLLLSGVSVVATIALGGAAYGVAYVTYLQHNSKICEVDFLLQAWNLIYVLGLFGGYISCLISSKVLLLPKFNVHAGSVYKKKEDDKIISLDRK